MSMTYQDYFIPDVMSNCCSAPIVITDMCSECYEHCEPIEQEMYPMGIRPIPKFVVDEDYGCVVGQHQDYYSPIFHDEEDDDEMSSMQQTA